MRVDKIDKYTANIYESLINPASKFIIAGYWWGRGNTNRNSRDNLTYDQLADRLMDDCKRYNVNCILVEIPEFAVPGGYQFAINFKPSFIKYMVNKHPDKLIVTLDTDMTIRKYPSIFDLDYDFMAYNWNNESRSSWGIIDCYTPYLLYTSGGLLCFRKSKVIDKFLEEWEGFSKKYPGKSEDRTISIVFDSSPYVSQLRCLWLPMEYFIIPFFYEFDDDPLSAPSISHKYFQQRGIKFSHDGYTKKAYLPVKFFNIKKNNYVIIHPERLTEEEMAHQLGADPDRVPKEFYISQGLKRRCIKSNRKLVINPTLFVDNRQQIKDLKRMHEMQDITGFVKYDATKMHIKNKPKNYKSISKMGSGKNIFISCVESTNDASVLARRLKTDYVIYIGNNIQKYKPYLILKTLKKYDPVNVTYICPSAKCTRRNMFMNSFYDFACVNASAYPVYKPRFVKQRCNDSRILQCLTTDVLMFGNSKFAKNLLLAWDNEIKRGIDDRYALSIAYNKYEAVLWTRTFWLEPSYFVPENDIFVKDFRVKKAVCTVEHPLERWNKKVNIYDYLAQCGEKPAVKEDGIELQTHYKGSIMKNYKYKYLY